MIILVAGCLLLGLWMARPVASDGRRYTITPYQRGATCLYIVTMGDTVAVTAVLAACRE